MLIPPQCADIASAHRYLPAQSRIVVAMSGGVDSSVAAALLVAQGYEVVGVTLQLYNQRAPTRPGSCCAGQDIKDARLVAEKIGIPHYVLDYEKRFRQSVIDPFADSYLRGETPIPCILCNQTVKFQDLAVVAQDLGAHALATGHYVQRFDEGEEPEMHRAVDQARDQSYFLFSTTKQKLTQLHFPIGAFTKPDIRAFAQGFGLPVAEKPDSQDICFVPNGRYTDLIAKLRPEAQAPGEIWHLDGRLLGRHEGIFNFTIGQRRGLGVGGADGAMSTPLYVIRLEPETRRVIVGPYAALGHSEIVLADVNWLGAGDMPVQGRMVQVKTRSTQPPVSAKLLYRDITTEEKMYPDKTNKLIVRFETPQAGVSAGQACVFYDDTRLLGGGWIEHAP